MTALGDFPIPRKLADATRAEHRDGWLAKLPARIRELERRWSLRIGAPYEPGGQTAWVAPARSNRIGDAVIKVEWRHPEATHEADALRQWDGDGAVRLHANLEFDDTIALLIEQCRPGTPLADRPEDEQDRVIAGLLRRLWRAPNAGHQFRPLQEMCDAWATELEHKSARRPMHLDPGLVREGAALFRALPASAMTQVLLCTDLHARNVLAATREPWLAIDPNPYVGDPIYDALQHLLNCDRRLQRNPYGLAHRLADLLDLDHTRLLQWLFARCVIESIEYPSLARVAILVAPT